jgi:hypothetical protein
MGFSGGGSNILKPHTHDSNILQDGGNLDFKNITQSDMSAKSMTYSDGSHLQELAGPASPAGEVLTFATAATAPAWIAPGVNQDRLEQLAFFETANATTDTVALTFTQIDFDDYASLYLTFSGVLVGACDIEVTMGTGSSYRYAYEQSDSGTWTNVNATGQTEWKLTDLGAGTWFVGHCWLYPMQQNEGVDQYAAQWQVTGLSTSNSLGGGFTSGGSHDLTSVTVQTSTSYFQEHCRFNLMGLRRS